MNAELSQERKVREIGTEVATVTSEKPVGQGSRVATHQEVCEYVLPPGHRRVAHRTPHTHLPSAFGTMDTCPSSLSVAPPGKASDKQRLGSGGSKRDAGVGKKCTQGILPVEKGRHFCVDDLTDDDLSFCDRPLEKGPRRGEVLGIGGEDVQEDISVYGGDQGSGCPRKASISSSVRPSLFRRPTHRSRLGPWPERRKRQRPLSTRTNSTSLPRSRPRASRTSLGIVT